MNKNALNNDLSKKVYQFCLQNRLFEADDLVLLAVSGGPDSVLLTLILNNLKENFSFNLALFHYDHQIRKNSQKDAIFVAGLAKKLNLKFYSAKGDVKAFADKNKKSLQEAARDLRYKALIKTASKIKATKIATAHQANDQAETFFHRLLRGAALTGLSAIPVRRDNIVRPLLSITKSEIVEYLRAVKQPYLTDPSNVKPTYFRNRIRHELMPVLEQLNPDYLKVILKNIKLINEEESLIDLMVKEIALSLIKKENDVALIRRLDFSGLSITIKRRLIREAILNIKGDLQGIEYKHINLIAENFAKFGYTLELPGDLLAYNDYDDIKIAKTSAFKATSFTPKEFNIGETIVIKQLSISIEAQATNKCQSSNLVVCLDYDKLNPPFRVRSRKNGDNFRPLGTKGTKKLQDYFVDKKVSKHGRDSILIIEDSEKIIWVAGFQIDERVKIDNKTKKILKLSVR